METLRNLSQTLINFFSFPLTDLKTSALLKQEFSVSPVCNSPGQRGKAHRLEKELRTPTRSTDHPKPSLQSSALFGSASNIMSLRADFQGSQPISYVGREERNAGTGREGMKCGNRKKGKSRLWIEDPVKT